MVKCPKCGNENIALKKEWYRGPKSDPKKMRIQHFVCSCGTSYVSWVDAKSGALKVMTR